MEIHGLFKKAEFHYLTSLLGSLYAYVIKGPIKDLINELLCEAKWIWQRLFHSFEGRHIGMRTHAHTHRKKVSWVPLCRQRHLKWISLVEQIWLQFRKNGAYV